MLYLYSSGYDGSNVLTYILGGLVALGAAVLVIVRWMRPGDPIPSVGEAQAIGQATPRTAVKTLAEHFEGLAAQRRKPVGMNLGQVQEFVRRSDAFQDDEPDETDGPDEDREVPVEDDGYPQEAVSGVELSEQVRRDSEIKDEPVLFASMPALPSWAEQSFTQQWQALTPEVLAALDAKQLTAEAVAA